VKLYRFTINHKTTYVTHLTSSHILEFKPNTKIQTYTPIYTKHCQPNNQTLKTISRKFSITHTYSTCMYHFTACKFVARSIPVLHMKSSGNSAMNCCKEAFNHQSTTNQPSVNDIDRPTATQNATSTAVQQAAAADGRTAWDGRRQLRKFCCL